MEAFEESTQETQDPPKQEKPIVDRLYVDIIRYIANYLEPWDLNAYGQVCKLFYRSMRVEPYRSIISYPFGKNADLKYTLTREQWDCVRRLSHGLNDDIIKLNVVHGRDSKHKLNVGIDSKYKLVHGEVGAGKTWVAIAYVMCKYKNALRFNETYNKILNNKNKIKYDILGLDISNIENDDAFLNIFNDKNGYVGPQHERVTERANPTFKNKQGYFDLYDGRYMYYSDFYLRGPEKKQHETYDSFELYKLQVEQKIRENRNKPIIMVVVPPALVQQWCDFVSTYTDIHVISNYKSATLYHYNWDKIIINFDMIITSNILSKEVHHVFTGRNINHIIIHDEAHNSIAANTESHNVLEVIGFTASIKTFHNRSHQRNAFVGYKPDYDWKGYQLTAIQLTEKLPDIEFVKYPYCGYNNSQRLVISNMLSHCGKELSIDIIKTILLELTYGDSISFKVSCRDNFHTGGGGLSASMVLPVHKIPKPQRRETQFFQKNRKNYIKVEL